MKPTDRQRHWGEMAQHWLDRLAECSEPGPGVTRLPFTPEHRAALDVLRELMEGAGLTVRLDAAGTLIGEREGPTGAPALLLGSHQDSVREAGGYDGIMGVVLPVLALKALREDGVALPYPVEVMAFADEEGVRFPTALMGPRALAGSFDPSVLALADANGVSLRDAMLAFGLDPEAVEGLRRDPADVLGWIEAHLEQGPVLESERLALGVVTGICGIERHSVTLSGRAAHAGTVPMALRRDALAAAAELVLAVERSATESGDALANVGQLEVRPGVVNAVPGGVSLTIEIRSPFDASRQAVAARIEGHAREIASRRGIGLQIARTYAQPAVPCDGGVQALLSEAVQDVMATRRDLPSGATHDTSAMADLCPAGMLFTTCRDGISHHPDEHVPIAAMGMAVEALALAIQRAGRLARG